MFAHRNMKAYAMVLLAAAAAGCSNPVGEGSHIRPDAFEVRSNGGTVVSGTRPGSGPAVVSGNITVQVGQAVPVTVHYFRQGQELTVPHGYWLRLRTVDGPVQGNATPPALISWDATPAGGFTGSIRGVTPGTGVLTFDLMHGPVGSGHEDFSISVPLMVQAP